ncbi:MAG: hypothetical protein OXE58_13845 [Acidobacteria bacterium]|nr:hypothetical protein [Acidobacteriota bacterium]
MADRELVRIAKTIVWDYNYDPEDLAEVLAGNRERVGHFDKQRLFVRMLKSLPWHRTVTALGIGEVKRLLTPEAIATLWPPSLREDYERVRRLLRGDPVPPTDWGSERARQLQDMFLSDRWHRSP